MMQFVPTGGVTAENLEQYLRVGSVAAVGGTWLARASAIEEGNWATIQRLTAEAVAIVRRVRPQVPNEVAQPDTVRSGERPE